MLRKILLTAAGIALCSIASGATPIKAWYHRTSFNALPGWKNGDQQHALAALKQSCNHSLRFASMRVGSVQASPTWLDTCQEALHLPNTATAQQARAFFEENYDAFIITDISGYTYGTFTGYYEPSIPGSLKKTAQFNVPIYGKPRNLKRVQIDGKLRYRLREHGKWVRMPDREKIESGKLLPNTPVIAWTNSKIDRFFLQIQGSGSIQLQDGKRLLLGYNGQNGAPYYAIGKHLVEIGALHKGNVSMQTIKQWLRTHPNQAQKVMNMNPSFTFFRVLDTAQPIGAQGVPLTPGYSLAVDRYVVPYGSPIWLDTYLPKKSGSQIVRGQPLQRLMVAQDTGGAIKGAVRGDVFWGSGDRAEWLAGHMQSMGRYWLLWPKGMPLF